MKHVMETIQTIWEINVSNVDIVNNCPGHLVTHTTPVAGLMIWVQGVRGFAD